MGTPSRSELYTMWSNAIRIIDQTEKFGRSNSANLIGLLDTLEQSLEGDWLDDVENSGQFIRSQVAGVISPSVAAALQRPFLRQFCRSVIGRTNLTSDDQMWDEMYKYFVDNTQRVSSSVFTFGSPAAAAGIVGNGQIVRLNRDAYNFDIEAQHIDSKRALCVADYQTGTQRGNEVFQLVGQAGARDELQRSGSGLEGRLTGLTADDSLLLNASFSQFGNTAAAPDEISNWTSSVTVNSTNYSFDSTNYFRATPSDGSTSYALNMKVTARLTQKLSLRGSKLDPNIPYILAVVWNRAVGSATGTLVLRLGSQLNNTITVSAQTGWTVSLVPATAGYSCWYRQFAEDDLNVEIDWTRTAGELLIDDVILAPATFFDGSWYWALPASTATYIPWRTLDSYTWPDIATNTGLVQKWIYRAFGRYLPSSNGSSITWTDPAA